MNETLIFRAIRNITEAPPGSIVRLKDGGALMIVDKKRYGAYPPRLICSWYDPVTLRRHEKGCTIQDLRLVIGGGFK